MKLSVVSCAILAGCGGGGTGGPPPAATGLVAIGNSISWAPEEHSNTYEWSPSRGMAASSLATDYVHVAAASLGLSVAVQRNVASLELPAEDPINTIDSTTPLRDQIAAAVVGIDQTSDVVIELGDNAWTPPSATFDAFADNYADLLDTVASLYPAAIVCLSTWWEDAAKDAMISATCANYGGTYVYIGDIFPTRTDVIPPGEDPRIQGHPHDASMAIIGARVAAAL